MFVHQCTSDGMQVRIYSICTHLQKVLTLQQIIAWHVFVNSLCKHAVWNQNITSISILCCTKHVTEAVSGLRKIVMLQQKRWHLCIMCTNFARNCYKLLFTLNCISNGLQKTAGLARPITNACSHWSGCHRKNWQTLYNVTLSQG